VSLELMSDRELSFKMAHVWGGRMIEEACDPQPDLFKSGTECLDQWFAGMEEENRRSKARSK
jgi:hypothetical protein